MVRINGCHFIYLLTKILLHVKQLHLTQESSATELQKKSNSMYLWNQLRLLMPIQYWSLFYVYCNFLGGKLMGTIFPMSC